MLNREKDGADGSFSDRRFFIYNINVIAAIYYFMLYRGEEPMV